MMRGIVFIFKLLLLWFCPSSDGRFVVPPCGEALQRRLRVQMSVHIKCDSNFAMSHQILQRLRVHASFCLIAEVGMTADVWRNIQHLNAIDIVIFADHVVEAMFPMHCDQWHAVIVNIQEATVTVHKFLSWVSLCPQ